MLVIVILHLVFSQGSVVSRWYIYAVTPFSLRRVICPLMICWRYIHCTPVFFFFVCLFVSTQWSDGLKEYPSFATITVLVRLLYSCVEMKEK